ncbi:MAG: EamA family transporter [Gaiellales bacterium]
MRASRTLTGTLMVVGAVTLWGVNGTVSRVAMDAGLDPSRLAEVRITASAAVLLAWLLWRDRAALRLTRRELLPFAAFGGIGLVCVQWTYFEAIDRVPIGIALIIEYSAPLMVALWVRFVWRRTLPWVAWAAIPVAMAGLALVLGLGGGDLAGLSTAGVLWSLAAGVSYAYYVLHAESLTRRRSAPAVLGIGLGFGAVVLAVALPWWSFPWATLGATAATAPVDAPAWAYCTYVVLLGTVIPFALMLAGVHRIGADGASVTAMLEPILAGAVAWVALDQVLTAPQVLGGAIVLAAVTAAQASRARAARLQP